jgi:hypothetical protein
MLTHGSSCGQARRARPAYAMPATGTLWARPLPADLLAAQRDPEQPASTTETTVDDTDGAEDAAASGAMGIEGPSPQP